MGPGRRLYHKPCLSCTSCKKRLDSLQLVEHDSEPYCRSCHLRNFSTRDLRHQNVSPPPTSPTRSGSVPLATSPKDEQSIDAVLSPSQPAVESPVASPTEDVLSPLPEGIRPVKRLSNTPSGNTFWAGMNKTTPISPMSTGSSTSSAGRTRSFGGGGVPCPKCGKSVYFAEQVNAIGKKWHKACLRCTECNTSLDSTKLSDRDGEPYCRNCYAKLYGPAGAGYALLGKAGG